MERKRIIYCAYNTVNGKRYIGKTTQELSDRKRKHYSCADCPYFHNALMKYPKDKWEWTIIDEAGSPEELNDKEKYWIAYYDTHNPEKGYNLTDGGDGGERTLEEIRIYRNKFVEMYGKKSHETNRNSRNIRCVETGIVYKNAAEASRQTGVHHSHMVAAANGKLKTSGGFHWEWCFDISLFPNAIYCKELDKYYTSYNEANRLDNFSGVGLSRAFKKQGSPCQYAGYTFYRLND